jgi:ferredoxin-NADP reductase
VVLIGGGSGLVPLMVMVRARARAQSRVPFRLIYSVRTLAGRVKLATVEAHGGSPDRMPTSFVCGPTGFVEAVADILVAQGHEPGRVKTERFGPSGS